MPQIAILLPHGEIDSARTRRAPRLASLAGKRIGFIDNGLWDSMRILADEMAKALSGEHGVSATSSVLSAATHGHPETYRQELKRRADAVDAVVSGLGN
jgi:hypothetical protein